MTPTARSLGLLRRLGFLAEVVERDRARTRAETAIANMQAAQAERGTGTATPRSRVAS
jgi:hypothetical protein